MLYDTKEFLENLQADYAVELKEQSPGSDEYKKYMSAVKELEDVLIKADDNIRKDRSMTSSEEAKQNELESKEKCAKADRRMKLVGDVATTAMKVGGIGAVVCGVASIDSNPNGVISRVNQWVVGHMIRMI